jgi:uncharacterized protein YndB with AHSA1/START domain
MKEPSIIHNTFVIEREYPVAPARVFAAFANPAQKRLWFVESDHNEVEHHEMDFRAGGKETARFRIKPGTPVSGRLFVTDSTYLDIVPNERLVFASTMALDEQHISAALVTAEFLPSKSGTALVLTHQGAFFPGSDGPEMRKEGWETLLDKLNAELAH